MPDDGIRTASQGLLKENGLTLSRFSFNRDGGDAHRGPSAPETDPLWTQQELDFMRRGRAASYAATQICIVAAIMAGACAIPAAERVSAAFGEISRTFQVALSDTAGSCPVAHGFPEACPHQDSRALGARR